MTKDLPAHIRMRPMQASDLRTVIRLDRRCQPVPWPAWCFRSLLRLHVSCWVVEAGDEIIGFGIARFSRQRAHIMNMCVASSCRRRGVGRHIMLQLLTLARQHHCRHAWLEVRPANRSAIILYRKLGFRPQAIRRNYYISQTGRQDALIMARPLRSPIISKH